MQDGGLHGYLARSAARRPEHTAVVDPTADATLSYVELETLAGQVRDRLRAVGVAPGDRVGLLLRKSLESVTTIFGILKCGAAYVPVDPTGPVPRAAGIFRDCAVRAVVVEADLAAALQAELGSGRAEERPAVLVLDRAEGEAALTRSLEQWAAGLGHCPVVPDHQPDETDVAYILYTSGSTGRPKGVTLGHGNATSFVDWCSDILAPGQDDRFSSHAPFHFDLSVLDIFLTIKHGGTLVLIGEELSKNPAGMVEAIARERLTVWYSTPSVLTLLLDHGRLAERDDCRLRMILFAGEVFPVKHLRRLVAARPEARYFNLYGPTETNVCTYYEVTGPVPETRTQPYPIGRVCEHLRGKAVDGDNREVPDGEEGELLIAGPAVMQGYWNLPERTSSVFHRDADGLWYRTGDVVVRDADGDYIFVGRRDRMVKRRGYRIELGEIEAALYRHDGIREVAAIATPGDDGVTIRAFYASADGRALSMIELKSFCARHLPLYMVPDRFAHLDSLPKTSTDKIDYQRLKEAI